MFDRDLAEMRFGYGRAPGIAPPSSPDAMLAGLVAPDTMREAFPIEDFEVFKARMVKARDAQRAYRRNIGTAEGEAAKKRRNVLNKEARQAAAHWMGQSMLRAAYSPNAFRERLVAFWADHFTARGKNSVIRRATGPYIDQAIRPHIAGSFRDMLKAAIMHPLMLHYLDQARSIGPNSHRAKTSGGNFGINENLAREVLELHTLGVGAPYTQTDVSQLATLFTGMTMTLEEGLKFRKNWAEPGPETVLGRTYPDVSGLEPIRAVLDDLADRPETAQHIARKMAVHFTSDVPDPALVQHLAARFADTGGDLTQTYAALLEHPAAWKPELVNIKPPAAFMTSAMRALEVDPARMQKSDENTLNARFLRPLYRMGQPWQRPPGPDGWAEEDAHWITPQGLAWRIRWSVAVPVRLIAALPDPNAFVDVALGSRATERVRFAATAAERRAEGIGVVLMSPAFQRR